MSKLDLTTPHPFIQSLKELREELLITILLKKDILSTKEAAVYIGRSIHTMRKYGSNKDIPSTKPKNKHRQYKRTDLDDFLSRNPTRSIRQILEEVNC